MKWSLSAESQWIHPWASKHPHWDLRAWSEAHSDTRAKARFVQRGYWSRLPVLSPQKIVDNTITKHVVLFKKLETKWNIMKLMSPAGRGDTFPYTISPISLTIAHLSDCRVWSESDNGDCASSWATGGHKDLHNIRVNHWVNHLRTLVRHRPRERHQKF